MQVIYYDTKYYGSWISKRESIAIAEYFKNKGFEVLDAVQLRAWMEHTSTLEKTSTDRVVIFAIDIMPDSVFSPKEYLKNSLIWKYLMSAGKVVWFGDIPFYSYGEPNKLRQDLIEYGTSSLDKILGVVSINDTKLRQVNITEHGISVGLTNSWNGVRPVKIISGLTPLAISKNDDGKEEANAWEIWNFIRLYDINNVDDPSFEISDHLNEIYQIAISPIEKIRKKEKIKRDIFIVHGHDEEAKNELEEIVKKLGYQPKYLRDFGSGSETLIDKLNKAKNCPYTIVLLTPDDLGAPMQSLEKLREKFQGINHSSDRNANELDRVIDSIFKELKGRARQNVVFELGFFKSILGDKNVTVLLKKSKDHVWDFPSDIHGGYYLEYENSIKEKETEICKNLESLKG